MTENSVQRAPAIHPRIREEMLDSFDEEFELEIDDDRLDALTNEILRPYRQGDRRRVIER